MKIDGSCACGAIRIEGEADPEKNPNVPLHRLPVRHRHRVSRFHPGSRREFQDDRHADNLPQDDGGQRQAAGAGVLSDMRFADLFDDAGRWRAAVLYGARRPLAAARPTHSAAAELVSLGAAVGDRDRTRSPRTRNRDDPGSRLHAAASLKARGDPNRAIRKCRPHDPVAIFALNHGSCSVNSVTPSR